MRGRSRPDDVSPTCAGVQRRRDNSRVVWKPLEMVAEVPGSQMLRMNKKGEGSRPGKLRLQSFASIACGGWPGVAGGAGHWRIVRLVATDAACHGCHARGLGHCVELAYIAVAHRALHAGLQMFPVRPGDAGGDLIDAHPGNGLAGGGEARQLHNRGFVFRHRRVASHARARCRKRHLVSGIGICVAQLALQA